VWLATATRIKGCAVQDDSAFGGVSGDDRRSELLYIAIGVTEQLSHGYFLMLKDGSITYQT
jgi:hypothetical protein